MAGNRNLIIDTTKEVLTIMVVEDQLVFIRYIKNALKSHNIVIATTVEEAKDIYDEEMPDMIFLDIELPDGNGYEVLDYVRNQDQNAFVVMLTSSQLIDDIEKSKRKKVNGYVSKPFSPNKLDPYIDQYLLMRRKEMKKAINEARVQSKKRQAISYKEKRIEDVKALYVDSVEHNREVVQKELLKVKAQTSVAGDVAEAIKKIKETNYNIIFIDCDMEDCMEIIDAVKSLYKNSDATCRLVGLGKHMKTQVEKEWISKGINKYIQKPLPISVLNQITRDMVGN
jgi:CheY-like chemotaxis protein